ncbi:MAG TPA: hypothetical protein VNH83_20605 [Bryobacteraceae bacterium]|nr:hypothetical protein [Bryobacteraceae bacterium]
MPVTLDRKHLALSVALVVAALILAGVFHEWRIDLAKAEADKRLQDQVIAGAEKREDDRKKAFEAQLAELSKLRATSQTSPQTVIERIPQLINFPTPAKLEAATSEMNGQLVPPKPDAPKVNLVLPPDDQRVLVNTLVECKSCQLERDKLKADAIDADTKYKAMAKERDDWKTAARGGSFWTRTKRALKWVAIGGAIGVVAAKATK